MKIQLMIAGHEPRTDYVNIDPLADGSNPLVQRGDVSNLDTLVDDAEADEILALDVIDYLPAPDLGRVLDNWVRKLRHGGSITVGGVDIREVARSLAARQLSIPEANALLYGPQREPWEYRKTTLTTRDLVDLFTGVGLKVTQKRMTDYRYTIKAERP